MLDHPSNKRSPSSIGTSACLSICAILLSSCLPPELENEARRLQIERERRIEGWIADLTSPDGNTRKAAAERLLASGDDAYPFLFHAAAGNNKPLQIEAVKVLSNARSPKVIDFLVRAMGNAPYPEVRSEIAEALGKIGDPSAVPGLLAFAEREDVIYVKCSLARVLGDLRDRRSNELLIRWMGDDSPLLRERAIKALGLIADDRSAQPLINQWRRMANYESLNEQCAIAAALGAVGSPEAVKELLVKLTDSPSIRVRSACAAALGRTHSKDAADGLIAALLDPSETVFRSAHDALTTIAGKENAPVMSTDVDARRRMHEAWMKWRQSKVE